MARPDLCGFGIKQKRFAGHVGESYHEEENRVHTGSVLKITKSSKSRQIGIFQNIVGCER